MSDIVWAIDPARDTPAHLLQRMRRVAYELLGSGGVQLQFTSSGDASPRLTADVRRHVFLMFKEILNNVVRHANATVVRIEVTVAPRQLHVVVTDDGRGFDTAGGPRGPGIAQSRAPGNEPWRVAAGDVLPGERNARDVQCPGALRAECSRPVAPEAACLPEYVADPPRRRDYTRPQRLDRL